MIDDGWDSGRCRLLAGFALSSPDRLFDVDVHDEVNEPVESAASAAN